MTNLVSAYQNNDIIEYEKILKTNHSNIMDDPFIREHIDELLQNIRTQVLIKLIKLYTRIYIPFISKVLIFTIICIYKCSVYLKELFLVKIFYKIQHNLRFFLLM